MCEKCVEIDKTIARYRRIQRDVTDQKLAVHADELIAELEADKAVLQPE